MKHALMGLVAMLATALAVGLVPAANAAAAALAPTTTTLTAPPQVTQRVPVTLTAKVAGAGEPATGVIRFEQQTATGWAVLGDVGVDAAGNASLTAAFDGPGVTLRATYLGTAASDPSTSAAVSVTAAPQVTAIRLNAPRSVEDESTLKLSAKVRTPFVAAVPGAEVSFQVYKDKKWRTIATARTDSAGVARMRSRPRTTYRYRARVTAGGWYTGAQSGTATVENTPPGKAIKLPRRAPSPRKLPAQPRATGAGANATVSTISSGVWKSMTGRSWRAGCPVGRSRLRLVRVNYWGFDGYRHRGEIVVNRSISAKTARAFTDLYRNRVSIRAMYRIDRFGYSKRLRGGDDYESMAFDNTSGFNCRDVVGRAGVRSPHATGKAIDINPFENPYRYRAGKWVPNTWWHTRSAGTYAWTKKSHLVPRIMRRNGFRWTYGNVDAQHFDG